MQQKLYFAHPINAYNVPFEDIALDLVKHTFPQAIIENPNAPHHQKGYEEWKARTAKDRQDHKGMSYFYEEVLPACTGCVAMPFLDGRLGLGVAGEAKWFLEHGKPVFLMRATWDFGLFKIDPISMQETSQLMASDPILVVPHEETRLRTWSIYNKIPRPYETAHQVSLPLPEGFYPAT